MAASTAVFILAVFVAVCAYPFPPEDETHIQHVVDGKCTKSSWRTTFGHCECADGKVKCFFRPGGMMPHGPQQNLRALPYPFPPEDETHVQHVVDGKCTKESWSTVLGHCTCKDGNVKCFFYPGGMKPGLLQLYGYPRYNNTRPYYPSQPRPNYNYPYQRYNASRHGGFYPHQRYNYSRIHFF